MNTRQRLYAYIRRCHEHGYMPTYEEMQRACGVTAIKEHLRMLERLGLIERTGKRRGIRLGERAAK